MQISTSTQAQIPGEAVGESLLQKPVSNFGNKKEKQGLFAKLLDSLTGKSQKTIVNVKDNGLSGKNIGKIPEKENLATGTGAVVSPKKNDPAPVKQVLSADKQKIPNEKKASSNEKAKINNEKGDNYLLLNVGEPKISRLQNNPDENTLKTPVVQVKKDSIQTEKPVLTPANQKIEVFQQKEKVENPVLPEDQAGKSKIQDKNKTGKAAVDFLAARNPDKQLYQFSGEPKIGLVDVIAAKENRENPQNTDTRVKKGKERAVLDVKDLRTADNRQQGSTESSKLSSSSLHLNEKIDADIPVNLVPGSAKTAGQSSKNTSLNSGLDEALAQKLRDGLDSDIVRQASVILRDGGEGTIRLSLKPESLGNVKIRLEMTENKITGHIIVESNEALRAFERELPVLEKAFADSGFSETNLEMFLAQDNGNYNPNQGQNGDFPNGIYSNVTPEVAASHYESGADRKVNVIENINPDLAERPAINMLV